MYNHSNYTEIYNHDYFFSCDGIVSWNKVCLKFGDTFAALCYAHNISWNEMKVGFLEIEDDLARDEIHSYTIKDQQEFLIENKRRTPKKILEIGGGRGEVSNFLTNMNYDVVSVDPQSGADFWYKRTGEHFFGEAPTIQLINKPIESAIDEIDLESFDTILIIETLEHIPEKLFKPVYDKIKTEFTGLFIITNWIHYHPIFFKKFQTEWEHPHCRHVDDNLYDRWSNDAKRVSHRYGSHIVLEY